MRAEQYAKYDWAREIDAWTITMITGRGLADVVRLYGGDPDAPLDQHTFVEAAWAGFGSAYRPIWSPIRGLCTRPGD